MFRLLRLRPPHGWNAVAWELGIVTLGVLIALGAQQWAEARSWDSKVAASKAALREELKEHYNYAVEFRVVYPCLKAQVDALRNRVISSGPVLDPAPIYHEPHNEYVFRLPDKFYPTDAWQEAISDGTVQRFDPSIRRQFAGHYASLERLARLNLANNETDETLMALARRMPLDPSVRFNIVGQIERLSRRLQNLDGMNGQVIDYIEHIGMVPSADEAQSLTAHYGTYRFCREHGLPMRPFREAMVAVPN